MRYWLTRDRDIDGVLAPYVDVWRERPLRYRGILEDVFWLDASDTLEQRECRMCLAGAKAKFMTVPDTDIECVRYS